jgi:putative membrane protein
VISLDQIPGLNASLNAASTFCLLAGFISVKNKKIALHKSLMVTAFIFSSFFLGFYLYYHAHVGSKVFPDLGIIKTIYLAILIPHIILAAVMVPLIFTTFFYALKGNFIKHKKWAKITLPIWLYVSITGILIYLMLYRWFGTV